MGNCKSNSNQSRQPVPTPPAGPPPRPPPIPLPSQTSTIPPHGPFPGFPKGPPPPIHHNNNSLKIPPRMPSTNLPKGPPLKIPPPPPPPPKDESDRSVAIIGVAEEILPQQPQQDPPITHIEDESLITEGHSPSPKRSHWNTFRSAAHIIGMTANRTVHSAPKVVQPSPIIPPAPAPEEIVTSATPSPSTNKWGVLRAATKLAVMASPKRNIKLKLEVLYENTWKPRVLQLTHEATSSQAAVYKEDSTGSHHKHTVVLKHPLSLVESGGGVVTMVGNDGTKLTVRCADDPTRGALVDAIQPLVPSMLEAETAPSASPNASPTSSPSGRPAKWKVLKAVAQLAAMSPTRRTGKFCCNVLYGKDWKGRTLQLVHKESSSQILLTKDDDKGSRPKGDFTMPHPFSLFVSENIIIVTAGDGGKLTLQSEEPEKSRILEAFQKYAPARIRTVERKAKPREQSVLSPPSPCTKQKDEYSDPYVELAQLEAFLHQDIAAYGTNHVELCPSYLKMARWYSRAGDMDRMNLCIQQAITIAESKLGTTSPVLARILLDAANIREHVGNVSGQRALLLRALKVLETNAVPWDNDYNLAHKECTDTLMKLKRSYGSMAEAERDILLKTLELQQAAYGPVHLEIADTLQRLAAHYKDVGDVQSQHSCLARVMEIYKERYGCGNPKVQHLQLILGEEF